MQRFSSALRGGFNVIRMQSRQGSGFKSHKELDMIYKRTMEHLPKPSGAWQEGFASKDRKATVFLIVGATLLAFSLAEMTREGCFDMLMNPADWSDAQVERQARYYEKGNPYRKPADDDE